MKFVGFSREIRQRSRVLWAALLLNPGNGSGLHDPRDRYEYPNGVAELRLFLLTVRIRDGKMDLPENWWVMERSNATIGFNSQY